MDIKHPLRPRSTAREVDGHARRLRAAAGYIIMVVIFREVVSYQPLATRRWPRLGFREILPKDNNYTAGDGYLVYSNVRGDG